MKHLLAFHPDTKIFRLIIVDNDIFFTQINRSQVISGIAPDTYSILEYHSYPRRPPRPRRPRLPRQRRPRQPCSVLSFCSFLIDPGGAW